MVAADIWPSWRNESAPDFNSETNLPAAAGVLDRLQEGPLGGRAALAAVAGELGLAELGTARG